MAPPLPTRNILLLTTALLVGGLFALHGIFQPPWDFLARGEHVSATSIWLVGPGLLTGAALTVGGVGADTGRDHPFSAAGCHILAVLVPVATLALLVVLHSSGSSPSVSSIREWLPVAAVVGLGVGLSTLFWQGVVQLELGKAWPAPARLLMVALLATVVWLPFSVGSEPLARGGAIWMDLGLISLTATILGELGISMRLLPLLIGITTSVAVLIHHGAIF